jgi:hypothetical protein
MYLKGVSTNADECRGLLFYMMLAPPPLHRMALTLLPFTAFIPLLHYIESDAER